MSQWYIPTSHHVPHFTIQITFKSPWIHSVLSSKCPNTQKETHINSISVWLPLTTFTKHVAALWEADKCEEKITAMIQVFHMKPLFSDILVTLLLTTVMKDVTCPSYKTSKSKKLSTKVSKAADVNAGGCCHEHKSPQT